MKKEDNSREKLGDEDLELIERVELVEKEIAYLYNDIQDMKTDMKQMNKNLEHLSNGGLEDRLQEQNEMLTEQLGELFTEVLDNKQQVDIAEIEQAKKANDNKWNWRNNKIFYGFMGGIIVKALDLLPQLFELLEKVIL